MVLVPLDVFRVAMVPPKKNHFGRYHVHWTFSAKLLVPRWAFQYGILNVPFPYNPDQLARSPPPSTVPGLISKKCQNPQAEFRFQLALVVKQIDFASMGG